jgi:glycosidase
VNPASFRPRAVSTIALLAAGAAGCGSPGDTVDAGFGPIPDVGAYDAGTGGYPGGDGGYFGDGSFPVDVGSDVGVDAPPSCSDALKRCAHTFTYPVGTETSVEVRGDYRDGAWTAGDAMTKSGANWTVTVPIPWNQPVQYKFYVNGTTWALDPNDPATATDATGNENSALTASTCATWTCAEPPKLPAGVFDWRDAVIYFVFVDRFVDGDPSNNGTAPSGVLPPAQYKGGDWAGVKQKIEAGYFNDLGVNTLWLTVPVDNADDVAGLGTGADTHLYSSYHGYWPRDPSKPEARFGTLADLQALVTAAHGKNLKVLLDYAMVHVHTESPLYAAHVDWFYPSTTSSGASCVCGSSACSWDATYLQCWFTPYLAHWNYHVPSALDASVSDAMQWVTSTGIDGFRLDAIKHVGDTDWLTTLRTRLTTDVVGKQSPQQRFYLVGETYDFSNRDFIKSFVDPATKLDGQFDFPLRLNLVQSILMRTAGMDALAGFMDGNDGYYGVDAVMSTFVGNHDLPRSILVGTDTPTWGDPYNNGSDHAWDSTPLPLPSTRSPFERLANALAVVFTNKGAPLLYYGDEIGLPGAGDPDNRRMMQWSGLSADQTWLQARVKALLAIRAAHPALRRGSRSTLSVSTDLWVYRMQSLADGDTVYVAINRSDAGQSSNALPSSTLQELLGGTSVAGPNITVPARQTMIFTSK